MSSKEIEATIEKFMETQIPVAPKDHVNYHCNHCGACCRNVKNSIPIESLDAFRLAKYLRDAGDGIISIEDFLVKYCEPMLIHECGYFMYALKTTEPEDSCIFLKDNNCTVHKVNPRACRMYPFNATPTEDNKDFNYTVGIEKLHHFVGSKVLVKNWMNKTFSYEDKEFLKLDFSYLAPIATVLKDLPAELKKSAIANFIWYKYTDYNLDESFLPQYRRNMGILVTQLRKLGGIK